MPPWPHFVAPFAAFNDRRSQLGAGVLRSRLRGRERGKAWRQYDGECGVTGLMPVVNLQILAVVGMLRASMEDNTHRCFISDETGTKL